ncbi:MAG: hypothetical protein ACR2NT_00430, partial [Acidimicrobiia bacterium]
MPFLSATGPQRANLIRVDVHSPLSSHATAEDTSRQTLRSKANPNGWQALQEPTGRHLDATGTTRNAPPVSIRH